MKKHDEKLNKNKDLENQLKRALADYQNLEKRIAEEKSSWVKSANKDLILRLLPGLDSLLLAEKHTEDKGVRVSIDYFLDILRKEGIETLETIEKEFDPRLMEAVSVREGVEGVDF